MNWLGLNPDDLDSAAWTILVGICCSVPCAILGCYLVLRRMSLLGDAISHAVLPGHRGGVPAQRPDHRRGRSSWARWPWAC